jgi:hypothetical protein
MALKSWDDFQFKQSRIKLMQSGSELLIERLYTLLRNGLHDQRYWNADYIDDLAKRMIDFQLPSVARKLYQLIVLPLTPVNIRLLRHEIRWMLLLCEWMQNFEALRSLAKLEVWQAAGAAITKKELEAHASFTHHWTVKSILLSKEDKLTARKVWVYSPEYDRHYAILDYVFGKGEFQEEYTIGENFLAESYLYPGLWPWRIYITHKHNATTIGTINPKKIQSILQLKSALLQLLNTNPFLQEFIFHCDQMYIQKMETGFSLIDSAGFSLILHPTTESTSVTYTKTAGQTGSFDLLWSKDRFEIL